MNNFKKKTGSHDTAIGLLITSVTEEYSRLKVRCDACGGIGHILSDKFAVPK
jgi:hypothetical protein